jgi:predicted cupin superfamily sugar epimerase
MTITAKRVKELLDLQPHPTCGFFSETYCSKVQVPAALLPRGYDGSRAMGGVLYFMVTPEAPVKLHRIRSDQMYHYYLGDPLEVLLLYPDKQSAVQVVGPDLLAGMRPQLLLPGGTYHAARLLSGGSFSLLGTSVWARPEPSDVEKGNPEQLLTAYPAARKEILAFAG